MENTPADSCKPCAECEDQCPVCHAKFSLAQCTRVDAPSTQPGQPPISRFFARWQKNQKQKQAQQVIDLTGT